MTSLPPDIPPQFAALPMQSTDRWPGVIGTIAILFGVAGVLQGCCGMSSSLFARQFFEELVSAMPQAAEMLAAQQAVGEKFKWMNAGLSLLSMLVAVMLLVGGSRLIGRRASSVPLLRTWAIAKLVLALIVAGAGWVVFESQIESMRAEQGANGPAASAGAMRVFGAFGVAVNLFWQWALPIFMLVWFSRNPIRSAVARWN